MGRRVKKDVLKPLTWSGLLGQGRLVQHFPGLHHFGSGAVGHKQGLADLEVHLGLDGVALGNARAYPGRVQGPHAAYDYGPFHRANQSGHHRPTNSSGPMTGSTNMAEPTSRPQIPPQKAPNPPQFFRRSPMV